MPLVVTVGITVRVDQQMDQNQNHSPRIRMVTPLNNAPTYVISHMMAAICNRTRTQLRPGHRTGSCPLTGLDPAR